MHPHVDSADADQDTPAQSHREPEEEGVLEREQADNYRHRSTQKQGARFGVLPLPNVQDNHRGSSRLHFFCVPREAGRDGFASFITVETQKSIPVNPTAIKMDCDQNTARARFHSGSD